MTRILGIHLILLGVGVFLPVPMDLYFGGVYDTWTLDGGDVIKIMNPTLNQSVIFVYLLKSSFRRRRDGLLAVDNTEYVIGGHVWLGSICIFEWYLAYINQTFCMGSPCMHMVWRSLFVL
jgi:photosystem II CP43 chlorophyll apoprotein